MNCIYCCLTDNFMNCPFYKLKTRLQMGPSIISDPINAGVQKSISGSGRSWSGS